MKKILQLTVFLSCTLSFGQANLPIYEGFDYPVGDKLFTYSSDLLSVASAKGSWTVMLPSSGGVTGPFTSGQDDILLASSPSWNSGLTSAGQAISFKGSGGDPHLTFRNPNTAIDNKTTTGSLYASFVFRVTDNSATTALSATQLLALAYPNSTNTSTTIGSAMMLRTSATGKGLAAGSGSFNIGIDKNGAGTSTTTWGAIDYPVDSDIFVVINYNFSDNTANIWINPNTSAQQTLPTLTATTGSNRAYFDRIRIQQSATASTPSLLLDEIRVATSWSEVLGGAAPPSSPVVEPRQVFNSSSNPKVSNLVPAPSTSIKWYATINGSELSSITPIASGTYYVTQTISGVESDKASTYVYVGDTALKTLPLYEPFNFTEGLKLVAINNDLNTGTGIGSWSVTPSAPLSNDDFTLVASPAWASSVLPAAQNSNAITFVGSGLDPELKFTDTTSGNLYSSFLYNAVDTPATIVASTTVGTDFGYSTPTSFYSFATVSADLSSTSYAAGVLFRKNMTTGKYSLGLSKSNNITECVWIPQANEFDLNTQHVIVIGYENIGDATSTNQIAKLWIDPATSSTTPSETLSQYNPTTDVSRDNIDRIKLLQASNSSTPNTIIDEIRVANNFSYVTGGPNLGVKPVEIASKSIAYPNPVKDGKLYISSPSSSQKQVAVYSILGQKVLEAKTTNNAEINVSKLAKGNYILKITEDGKSEAKKLIVQ